MAPDSNKETIGKYVNGASSEGGADCANALEVSVLDVPCDLNLQFRGEIFEVVVGLRYVWCSRWGVASPRLIARSNVGEGHCGYGYDNVGASLFLR